MVINFAVEGLVTPNNKNSVPLMVGHTLLNTIQSLWNNTAHGVVVVVTARHKSTQNLNSVFCTSHDPLSPPSSVFCSAFMEHEVVVLALLSTSPNE